MGREEDDGALQAVHRPLHEPEHRARESLRLAGATMVWVTKIVRLKLGNGTSETGKALRIVFSTSSDMGQETFSVRFD